MYKIIAGSSCDLTEEMERDLGVTSIPFKITIDGREYIDDSNLDIPDFIDAMKRSDEAIKTACPAPGDYLQAFKGEEDVFVLTISSNLSGAYNSATLARDMAKDEDPNKFIHVFDTKSASAGETAVLIKLKEEIDRGSSRDEIIKNVEDYIDNLQTFFILESLDNLIKNGRISKTKGLIANVLNFKPIMSDDGDGNIELYEKVRGTKKAFNHLIEAIGKTGSNPDGRTLVITHGNAAEKANKLKDDIKAKYNFKNILVVPTKGLCTGYADDGGIVLAY